MRNTEFSSYTETSKIGYLKEDNKQTFMFQHTEEKKVMEPQRDTNTSTKEPESNKISDYKTHLLFQLIKCVDKNIIRLVYI
mgnify:CR=1 FL=1